MIQCDVKCVVNVLVFLQYPLKKKCGFSDSSGPLYPDNSGIPVDLAEKVSSEIQIYLFYFSVVIVYQWLYIRTLHNITNVFANIQNRFCKSEFIKENHFC